MSQAMTIRKLMIILASTLTQIAQQDFIYKTEYDFPFQRFGPIDLRRRLFLRVPGFPEVAHNMILVFSCWKSLTFIGGIVGE